MRWQEMAVVGRVARRHGNRGEVIIDPETDFPEQRFKVGSTLYVERGARVDPLTITSVRFQRGRPIVGFEGIGSMDAAEALASGELRVPSDALQRLPAGSFYRHDLVGCVVSTGDGRRIGAVTAVEGQSAESRLVVASAHGEVLIPLAAEICVGIDVAARTIVVEPPEGLLELNVRGGKDASQGRF
jgi:16S rRNA processing protein RimM